MEENVIMVPGSGTKVIVRDVKQEIETAFLDYSMSVIVSRALPDVRDGLKPVHRRILYTMHERGNDPSHPYRKSADTVGAVLGAYHPHGDASVYDAMVRLAQDFSLRYPLVDGQGNFGSVDGDPPAAYRYTEARMSKIACEMLTDIDKDTIDWDPNFDETKKEPHMLPSRFPNLLVNGSSGIAVGSVVALEFACPLVFAKKSKTKNIAGDVYKTQVASFTHGTTYDVMVSKRFLTPEDRVLIVDDFLAVGNALRGLIDLVHQSGATLVGCGTVIEKGYQHGGDQLRAEGVRVESLAIVESMDHTTGQICFRD